MTPTCLAGGQPDEIISPCHFVEITVEDFWLAGGRLDDCIDLFAVYDRPR